MITTWQEATKPYCVNHPHGAATATHLLIARRSSMPVCHSCAYDHKSRGDTVVPVNQ